ncbi:MAG TPA: hypothetical protein VF021_03420 [Longimicrobiales bacterium]
MTAVDYLKHLCAPWQSLYSNSSGVSVAVTATHIVSLVVGGGLAIAADRTTLRALRRETPDWPYHLAELHAVHRPVVIMLTLLFISGALLAAADIETFATSVLFWIKLSLVALLLLNGSVLYNAETRLARAHDAGAITAGLQLRLKLTSYASLALWLLTAITGTVLTIS